jgi:hypothetical protein
MFVVTGGMVTAGVTIVASVVVLLTVDVAELFPAPSYATTVYAYAVLAVRLVSL